MSTSSKNNSQKISVGYISSAHGVRGGLRVVPLTDYPERFSEMKTLELYAEQRFVISLPVRNVKYLPNKGEVIVECDIQDRDAAERLVGLTIMVDSEDRVELPPDTFWIDDLIGLDVRDTEGTALGVVNNYLTSGGYETYEVRDSDGRMHYIPAVDRFVKKIDLPSRTITVELIEGLWD